MIKLAQRQINPGSLFNQTDMAGRTGINVPNILNTALTTILYIAGFIAVFYLIWNGIAYIMSAGDETKATKAKTGLIYAVIGILVIALSFAIANYLTNDAITNTVGTDTGLGGTTP